METETTRAQPAGWGRSGRLSVHMPCFLNRECALAERGGEQGSWNKGENSAVNHLWTQGSSSDIITRCGHRPLLPDGLSQPSRPLATEACRAQACRAARGLGPLSVVLNLRLASPAPEGGDFPPTFPGDR